MTKISISKTNKDRRVQRTRDALRTALMELLIERGWDGVDVRSLCERANIGRSTFYQHYENKEALLNTGFDNLSKYILNLSKPDEQLGFVPGLVNHVYEAKDVFRALVGRRSGRYVQQRFREMLLTLIKAGLPKIKKSDWQSSARMYYLAGAFLELIEWWLSSNRPHKPDEIINLYYQLSNTVLAVKLK